MATEKTVVQRALDECGNLKERIERAISTARYVGIVRGEVHRRPVDAQFKDENSLVTYIQSTTDRVSSLRKRFFALQSAINKSNAVTNITVKGETMTVSDALLRKRYAEFERNELQTIRKQLEKAQRTVNENEHVIKQTVEERTQVRFGVNDANIDSKETEQISKDVRRDMELIIVDPKKYSLTIDEQISDLEAFLSAVDSEMVICNATTEITVDI